MTRNEQIRNAACHYSIKASENSWDRPDWEDIEWAFEAGAAWADEHPNLSNLHKWPEEKPSERGRYLIALIGFDNVEYVKESYYNPSDYFMYIWSGIPNDNIKIVAWSKMPKFPKFD